jgi:hypothetical protein
MDTFDYQFVKAQVEAAVCKSTAKPGDHFVSTA